MLNTGDWCLLPSLHDDLSSEISLEFRRVEIDAKQPLISLQWRFGIDGQLLQEDKENLLQTVSSSRGTTSICVPPYSSDSNMIELSECPPESEEDSLIIKMGRCSDHDTEKMSESTISSQPQLVDAVLTLSDSLGYEFRRWLVSLKRKLIPQLINVSEALQLCSHPATVLPNCGSNLGGILALQGEVVSIQGKLETTECSDNPVSAGDDDLKELSFSRSFGLAQQKTTLFQLRDLHTDQPVRTFFSI